MSTCLQGLPYEYSRTSLSGPPVGLGLKWSHSGVVPLVRVTSGQKWSHSAGVSVVRWSLCGFLLYFFPIGTYLQRFVYNDMKAYLQGLPKFLTIKKMRTCL